MVCTASGIMFSSNELNKSSTLFSSGALAKASARFAFISSTVTKPAAPTSLRMWSCNSTEFILRILRLSINSPFSSCSIPPSTSANTASEPGGMYRLLSAPLKSPAVSRNELKPTLFPSIAAYRSLTSRSPSSCWSKSYWCASILSCLIYLFWLTAAATSSGLRIPPVRSFATLAITASSPLEVSGPSARWIIPDSAAPRALSNAGATFVCGAVVGAAVTCGAACREGTAPMVSGCGSMVEVCAGLDGAAAVWSLACVETSLSTTFCKSLGKV